jgi:STE24 endopeptidase
MFASDILNTPFSIYDTFVIEEKFGFNKTTPKIYVLDKIKGWLLSAIIGGGILALIVWFYETVGELFWVYTWIAISAFMIFMSMFYSSLIVPLFNKQTPLEEGELKDEIQGFSSKVGFKLQNIFVIDGSKRSTKANAYFSGLGAKKRIVLFDTLIKDLSVREIVAVLAHEIGHYKKKHTLISIVISILQTGITLYILSLFINNPELSKSLGSDIPSFHLGLIAFGVMYSPVSTIIGLAMNIFSRKNEYQADKFADDNFDGEELISSLKKLSRNNLSNLTPHPAYVFFHYSHPTLLQRIRAIRKK